MHIILLVDWICYVPSNPMTISGIICTSVTDNSNDYDTLFPI